MKFETDWVSLANDYKHSQQGGFFDLSDWGVVQISGPDALTYLQRMSTTQFKDLSIGKSLPGAFLTGKGGVVAWGDFFREDEQSFFFVVSPGQLDSALKHLEMFHFQEKLEIKNETHSWSLVGLWNISEDVKGPHWRDFKRKPLEFILIPKQTKGDFFKQEDQKGFVQLGMPFFHYSRVLHGVPWMGWEIQPGDLVLEAGLEAIVARNKGCYPGQEVVERIFTYGQVNRKLFKVEIESVKEIEWLECPKEIRMDQESVGHLLSIIPIPECSKRAVGLAMIKKSFWEYKGRFDLEPGMQMSLSTSDVSL